MDLVGKVLSNRYEILEKIGDGGMATVYKAKCRLLQRYVAVKVLKREYMDDISFSKKFATEAQSAASLSHPNVVSIYDVGREDDINYIVMELIEGKTLKQIIKQEGKLNWKKACDIAYKISQGLEHAHKNHIIHRDVKPQNIIVTENMNVKVADFGIAKAASSTTITMSSDTMGSVHYFSPEQAKGGITTEKSDIYSLGIVLYEMLTGVLPFNGETPVSIALKHVQEEAKMPSDLEITVPTSVNNIVMKAIQKDPNLRYQHVEDMAVDISLALNNPSGDYGQIKNYNNFETQKIQTIKIDNNDENKDRERIKQKVEEFFESSKGDDNMDSRVIRNDDYKSRRKNKNGKKKFRRFLVFTIFGILLFCGFFYTGLYITGALDREPDIEIPDITKHSVEEAIKILHNLGLELSVVAQMYDSEIEKDYIITQNPESPMTTKAGKVIEVVVSMGTKKTIVPDVTTLELDDAIFVLEQNDLKYECYEETSLEVDKGKIIRQSHNKNDSVDVGTTIEIYVSLGIGDGKVKMPKLTEMTEEDARKIIETNNLQLKEPITYKSNEDRPNNVVLYQSIPEDSIIAEGTVVSIEVNKISASTDSPIANTDIKYDNGKITIDLSKMSAQTVNIKVFNDSKRILYDKDSSKSQGVVEITVVDTTTKYIEVYVDNNISARFTR